MFRPPGRHLKCDTTIKMFIMKYKKKLDKDIKFYAMYLYIG